MTRAHAVIGRIRLTEDQATPLSAGAVLVVGREQFRAHCRRRAQIGDLLWVQEPYHEWTPARWGSPTAAAIVAGPRFGTPTPKHIGGNPCRHRYCDGRKLPRQFSRATLEIVGFDPTVQSVTLRAHMVQIDAFLAAGTPAGTSAGEAA